MRHMSYYVCADMLNRMTSSLVINIFIGKAMASAKSKLDSSFQAVTINIVFFKLGATLYFLFTHTQTHMYMRSL